MADISTASVLRLQLSEPANANGTIVVARTLLEQASAEMTKLRNALWEVTTNGRWTEGEQCGEWAISKEVYDTAREAHEGGT